MTGKAIVGRGVASTPGGSGGSGQCAMAHIYFEEFTVPAATIVYPDCNLTYYDTDGFTSTATGLDQAPAGKVLLRIPAGLAGNYSIGYWVWGRANPPDTAWAATVGTDSDENGTGFSAWSQHGGNFATVHAVAWPFLPSAYSILQVSGSIEFDLIEGDSVEFSFIQHLATGQVTDYPLIDGGIWLRRNCDSAPAC